MKTKLICIIGPDGTGKTTQAELLTKKFQQDGVKCKYQWLRFYHFFSLPLLLVAKMMKLSEVVTLPSGKKVGYHYFWKSRFISTIYPILLLVDTFIIINIKVYFPLKFLKKRIICDRFIYDTIVDLMISTNNPNLLNTKIVGYFSRLIPKKSITFLLLSNEEILRERREDIKYDKLLKLKIDYYKILARFYNIITIKADLSIEDVQEIIANELT